MTVTFPFYLTVDPPKITTQPVNKTVAARAPTTFTVEATGDNLQFQWQKDDKDIDRNEPWLHCSQTDKSSTLHILRAVKSDKGYYKCLVKTPFEKSGVHSHGAELTVCELCVCNVDNNYSKLLVG